MTQPIQPHAEGFFLCPRCGRLAVRWADHRNTTCGSCAQHSRKEVPR